MRTAMAQRCFNPAGGRLTSLSRLRISCKPPGQPLSPLSCSMRLSPGFGAFSKSPWVSVSGAQPQSGPPSTSHMASLGWRLLPCGAGVAQGWQVECVGNEGSSSFSPGHTPCFGKSWMRANIPKELSGAGRGAQALPQAVCVWGVCALSPGQVQILPLAAEMFCVDLPGDARGWQPSSFPMDAFQGLPFSAETGQLVPPVLGVPAPAGLCSPLR